MNDSAVKNKPHVAEKDLCSRDTPTALNKPWIRVIINFLACMLLGVNFKNINSSFFTSVIMFVIPMLTDILNHKRGNKRACFFYFAEICLLFVALIVCLLGIFGILCIVNVEGDPNIMIQLDYAFFPGCHCKASYLLLIVFASFFLTVCDMFSATYSFEQVLITNMLS
ncbi:MAG: hypothetical protein VB078_00850 [Clostridiaceae bacterium]|nr:hypothetical protein [Clostridiaceae bacterium]